MTAVGARLPRKEDPRLLRGLGRFGDDLSAAGQAWARVVRSPAAVLNAINDALRPAGVSFDHIPVLPADVCRALAGSSLAERATTT